MFRIERFGDLWASALNLPLHNAKYAMPADQSMRTHFRKSDGGLFTPEGSNTTRLAPPETFVYQAMYIATSDALLEARIKKLSQSLGERSCLWAYDGTNTYFKWASMDSLRYAFSTEDHYHTAMLTFQFSLEHEGWLLTPVVLTPMQVTGNANVVAVAGNTMTIVHDGNMNNYRALDITISPTGGNLTSTKVTCLDYLTGAVKRTTLIYAGTVAAGEHLKFDWWSARATVNGVVVRPVTRGTTAAENTMTEWGMLSKTQLGTIIGDIIGGARLNIICVGSATFYEAEVYHFGMYAL